MCRMATGSVSLIRRRGGAEKIESNGFFTQCKGLTLYVPQ
ncbi:unnamed protein product [Staurois parvus]|uniref:Uncharacterized protein n=1 Tax=Staurois parvus TaxID=386267 RepID=A0ABN9F2Q3_9NEOB|nr:unnamed protein product [Staurois parvus]